MARQLASEAIEASERSQTVEKSFFMRVEENELHSAADGHAQDAELENQTIESTRDQENVAETSVALKAEMPPNPLAALLTTCFN